MRQSRVMGYEKGEDLLGSFSKARLGVFNV